MEEWQAKHCGSPGTPRLSAASPISTGFLDGTHPIVDAYELKVWGFCRCLRFVSLGALVQSNQCTPLLSLFADTQGSMVETLRL